MKPSIDAAKKLADLLNTTVGYLLGENEDADILKEPKMLERLKNNQCLYRTGKTTGIFYPGCCYT